MRALAGVLVMSLAGTGTAAVQTKEIEYEADGTKLKGVPLAARIRAVDPPKQ